MNATAHKRSTGCTSNRTAEPQARDHAAASRMCNNRDKGVQAQQALERDVAPTSIMPHVANRLHKAAGPLAGALLQHEGSGLQALSWLLSSACCEDACSK